MVDDAPDAPALEDDDDELEDERVRAPIESYSGIQPAQLPAMGPDGGPIPVRGIGPPAPIPAATPDIFVCLRGPCRHYWELQTHLVTGNPKGTWDDLRDEDGKPVRAPRQITRACTYQGGIDTQFTDDVVYACNRWDPVLPKDEAKLEKRRRVYLKLFPQYAPKE